MSNAMSNELAKTNDARISHSRVCQLVTFDNKKLNVIGETLLKCVIGKNIYNLKLIIVDANVNPILGQNICVAARLVKRVLSKKSVIYLLLF